MRAQVLALAREYSPRANTLQAHAHADTHVCEVSQPLKKKMCGKTGKFRRFVHMSFTYDFWARLQLLNAGGIDSYRVHAPIGD